MYLWQINLVGSIHLGYYPQLFVYFGVQSFALSAFPFFDNLKLAIASLWFLMFFGGISLPILAGVLMTKAQPEMRPRANSVANLMYQLLGFFPSPIIYGYACKIDGKQDSRAGMCVLMFATILMPTLIMFAIYHDNKKRRESVET